MPARRADNHELDNHRCNRRSIRLGGYDYSRAGAYFVTICTQNRECLFGRIVNGKMILNDAGRMIQTGWDEIPSRYPGIDIGALQIMPNHIHGIVAIVVGAGPRACPDNGQPQGAASTMSLPDVVHRFKSMTTHEYINGVKQQGWTPFPRKLWQRNYWEHIVRNETELNRIREYIANNPVRWEFDRLYVRKGQPPCLPSVRESTSTYAMEA